ncbi:hypothetical protein JKL49_07075 [Phenylobacterium sp. 20VBR1]|uniref:Lipoprotein n=1 Tax=Phenylobacterium glaciei TaxID=2803784 RepID=A0A941D0M2_9CAUL|nr:hypothetical protein [Phenylobacterium glaciei]MBR7619149.1 hypothetical protein [Phenylobacterium glaciei]
MAASRLLLAGAAALALAACSPQKPATPPAQFPATVPEAPAPVPTPVPVQDPSAPVEAPAPGSPAGLPDDRTPISEAPFTPQSAQGAANVVQTYYALIGEKKYAKAWALWGDGGKASGMTVEQFAASFDKYSQYYGNVGAPGEMEGAAGSSYVEVPAIAFGRLKTGEPFNLKGVITLKRVNDVPGSTAEQRKWHIATSGLKPVQP